MSRKNNYNFNSIDNLENANNYNAILVIYSDYEETIYMLRSQLNITIPQNTIYKYKGSKGEFKFVYNNNTKYILVKLIQDYNILSMIGRNIINDRESLSMLVIINHNNINISLCIKNILQGLYSFDELKSVKPIDIKVDFNIKDFSSKSINLMIEYNKIMYEIRDLGNKPVNKLNSTKYESHIRDNLNPKITMRVLNKTELEEEGLGLILAVNKGSQEEPKMIILDYNPSNAINKDQPICLVGKGVMFDTGGINLKPSTMSMADMKSDMIGSAIVYGILKALSLYSCNKRVIGILPIVQNDIGPNATHPGDVVTSYSGKTVEIIDIDAEGRLILADGVAYSNIYNPSLIIDIGSLTSQINQTFNILSIGYMTNNNNMKDELIKASEIEKESIVKLELKPEHIEQTKSKIADYSNYTYSNPNSNMAGAFIYNFLPNPYIPWLHLDIGDVSYNNDDTDYRCAGVTDNMFYTLFRFLMDINIDDTILESARNVIRNLSTCIKT